MILEIAAKKIVIEVIHDISSDVTKGDQNKAIQSRVMIGI